MTNKDKELVIDNYIKEYKRAIYHFWKNPSNKEVTDAINNLNNAYIMCFTNNHLKNIKELRHLILRAEKFQHVLQELKANRMNYEIQGMYFIIVHYDNEKYTTIDMKENGDVTIFDKTIDFDDWIAAPLVNEAASIEESTENNHELELD